MNPGGFVSKQQFQAVYDHFREVVAKAEAEENLLYVEFNLLLDYFRTVYSDSDRKSNKIMQLSCKAAKNEALLNELDSARARENADLSMQVNETKKKIDELVQKEHALLRQIDAMKAVIKKLKSIYKDEDEEKVREEDKRSFREFGIVTDEVQETGWMSCKICSKKSQEVVNQILKEIDDHERQEEVILEVNTKVNALMTELKMAYKERDDMEELVNYYNQLLQESNEKLELGERTRRGLEKHLSQRESMQVTIDQLVQDLYSKKCEVHTLQEDLQKERSKGSAYELECHSKEKHLEHMKRVLQAEREARETAVKKAEVFAKHLATDRERREAVHQEMSELKVEVEELRNKLKDCEAHQRALTVQIKVQEEHHRVQLLEHNHAVENYEVQMATKNKRIETLLNKLSKTEKQLELNKKQTKSDTTTHDPRSPSWTPTLTELERVRAELRAVNSAHRTAQCQLQTFRTALENQRMKMDRMKRANETLLKEKNKFYGRYRALDAKLEMQKLRAKFVMNERDCHRKVLRSIDNQVEKAAKEEERNRIPFRF